MALTKDQVIVWMTLSRNENQNLFFLLAAPYSRVKDLDQRLQSAYQHKVKGNRLDNLDPELLDDKNLPFAENYLSSLFRIAELAGFGGWWPGRSTLLETQTLEKAAGFLKEQFKGCQFIIRYEPKQFRSAALNTWIRKNQLPAMLDGDAMESLPAKTSRLLGALQKKTDRENEQTAAEMNSVISQLDQKLSLQVSMAPKWLIIKPEEIYLSMTAGKEKKNLKKLLEAVPELIEQGILDKWMKNRLAPGFFEKALTLAESVQGKELLLTLSASRIENQFEKLQNELLADQSPFLQEEFDGWASQYSHHFLAILPLEQTGLQKEAIHKNLRAILDQWIEKPGKISFRQDGYYLAAVDEKLEILETSVMNVLLAQRQSDSPFAKPQLGTKYHGLLTDLESFLDAVSLQHPLPKLYASGNLARWIRRWSVMNNRFLMLVELDRKQKEIIRSWPAAQKDLSCLLQKEQQSQSAPVVWADPRLLAGLQLDQILFLASNLMDPAATRLVALAFFNGLDIGKARLWLQRSKGSLYSLVRSYVFSTREQNFLDTIHSPAVRSLLMRPSLSLSKMKKLEDLANQGMAIPWLEANLKGNMSLVWLDDLKQIYPWNNLPWSWRFFCILPDSLASWLLEKAEAKNPKAGRESLIRSLASLNENADRILFRCVSQMHLENKPGSSNQKEAGSIQKEAKESGKDRKKRKKA